MVISKIAIPRRTVLRGLGATWALPLLDAMVPAASALTQTAAKPVRRFAIFLEQSIYNGIQWAVFEPNDEDLWSSLRLNIGAFMMTLFRAGAFQGDTPSKAFFVKCDAETNPQDQIDTGIVTVLVGFAALKPAEFVVIRISQQVAQAGA